MSVTEKSGHTNPAVTQNIGQTKNTGFEMSINSRNIVRINSVDDEPELFI